MLTLEASDLAEGAGHLTVINADGNAHSVNVDVTWDSCATIGDSTDGAPISGSYRITVR